MPPVPTTTATLQDDFHTAASAAVSRQFTHVFGIAPSHLSYAPGRVNLIGEHTDYNFGYVLPMSIEAGVYIAAKPRSDRQVRIGSGLVPEPLDIALDVPLSPGEPSWGNYVKGVIAGYQERGLRLPGFDAYIHATLPSGGGLSSSAALEVATATLIEHLSGVSLEAEDRALLCQQAEHEFAGVPCGIMDQFAVTFGQAGQLLLLDCRSRERTLVPMQSGGASILIINTMVKHALSDGGYAKRREQCFEAARAVNAPSLRETTLSQVEAAKSSMPEVVFRRARHVLTENDRTLKAVEALKDGAWSDLGRLMYASHRSLRHDFEVSCAELDLLVSLAEEMGEDKGVFGCRMTGGGFGGCVVTLVDKQRQQDIQASLCQRYESNTGRRPWSMISQPAQGASMLSI